MKARKQRVRVKIKVHACDKLMGVHRCNEQPVAFLVKDGRLVFFCDQHAADSGRYGLRFAPIC